MASLRSANGYEYEVTSERREGSLLTVTARPVMARLDHHERERMIERMMLHDDPQWRHGYSAALATVYGRKALDDVRRQVSIREYGATTLGEVIGETFRLFSAALAAAFSPARDDE